MATIVDLIKASSFAIPAVLLHLMVKHALVIDICVLCDLPCVLDSY